MKWKKYTINTSVAAEDILSFMLTEQGLEGVEIEDLMPLTESELSELITIIPPELPRDDGRAKVSFYLRTDDNAGDPPEVPCTEYPSVDASYSVHDRVFDPAAERELIKKIREELERLRDFIDIGEGSISVSEIGSSWLEEWKKHFESSEVGDFLIKPSWEELNPDEERAAAAGEKRLIRIDPGMAFGTGTHETTRLCLRALERHVREGMSVIDIGTGSGILGIASLMLGAGALAASEVDENCVPSIEENLRINHIGPESFGLVLGNVLADDDTKERLLDICSGGFGQRGADIAVANILDFVIRELALPGEADRLLRPGGIFITSGMLKEQIPAAMSAFKESGSWHLLETESDGEWGLLTMLRKGDIFDLITENEKYLRERKKDAHKADYGKLLIAAGSPGMAGAAYLSGLAALKTGVGMVRYLGPEENRVILQTLLPEAMYDSLPDPSVSGPGESLSESLKWADLMILGPGLSKSDRARALVRSVFKAGESHELSHLKLLIVDADALNIIADEGLDLRILTAETLVIVTPHVLEMKRIFESASAFYAAEDTESMSVDGIKSDPIDCALRFRGFTGSAVVLKDFVTTVVTKNLVPFTIDFGSPAMAKAGSGDVLTGFIAGISAVCRFDTEASVPLAVALHGRAGTLAAEEKGVHSLLARDIIDAASRAFSDLIVKG